MTERQIQALIRAVNANIAEYKISLLNPDILPSRKSYLENELDALESAYKSLLKMPSVNNPTIR